MTPVCVGCDLPPVEIKELVVEARIEDVTPDEFVRRYEGTYNPSNGHFWCTDCYIDAGMPLGVAS